VGWRGRWVGRVAVLLAVLSVACAGGGLALQLMAESAGRPVQRSALSDLAVAVLFPVVGAIVLRRDPRNRAGWVLLSCALVGVSTLAHQWAYDAGVARPGVLPLGGLAIWLSAWTYWPYWLQPTLLPVLFPSGAPSGRWRVFSRVVMCVAAVGALASAFKPDSDVEGMGLANPLGIGSESLLLPWVVAQAGCVALLALIASPIAIGGLAVRQRRATGTERAQLQWLLLGFTTCLVLGVLSAFVDTAEEAVFAVAFCAIPVSVAGAVVRHGLFDVELVVNRTIVYALLTGAGVLGYVALVAAAGRYVGSDGAGPVVAALVVAVAASARSWLQRLVDRRLFGARRDPYAVVQLVGESSSVAGVTGLVDAVREALRLPFVQVLDDDGEVVAESGAPVAGTHVLPVVERGRRLGVLVVGRRSRGERLRPEEESALRDVARRAGSLLLASELQEDLRRSYERTVVAREEERRRLRRDLHDGVGPALAGMALQLDSLAGRLGDDEVLAARAEGLRDRLRGTVGEVRRIVDGLRPAALDELGLAQALRQLATDDDAPVQVVVDADLPEELPAAVEVAAYRIAGEAVTNALRHADATSAQLRAWTDGEALHVEVSDDGRGFGADATAGVGLQSLHDRAAEVGGTLAVDSVPGSGTRVAAVLPIPSVEGP
jgi:signal transduction histidine kinase